MTELQQFIQTQSMMLDALNKQVKNSFEKEKEIREVREMIDDKIMHEIKQNEIEEAIEAGEIDPSELNN